MAYPPGVKRRALCAFSLPLALAGCLTGHAAAYALVGSSRQDALVHGYLAYAPQLLAVCVALLGVALAMRVTGRLQGRPAAWTFALLPPAAFVAQELLERLVAGLPAHAALETPVYVGLAAQLPIAAIAYVAARALVRVADDAARALSPHPPFVPRREALPALVPFHALRSSPLALDRLGRAPPGR